MARAVSEFRLAMQAAGFDPIPVKGKHPIINAWQTKFDIGADEIVSWGGAGTGMLCRKTPTLDGDITVPEAANDVEALARDFFDGRGQILVRFGNVPKRAIPFRTAEPFSKKVIRFVAPNDTKQKLEFLGDGQQVVVDGVHPDTGKPYSWHGGRPGTVAWTDLPEITGKEADEFMEIAATMLCEQHGFRRVEESEPTNGVGDAEAGERSERVDVEAELASIHDGHSANNAQKHVIPSLLRQALHPNDVLERVVDDTMKMAEQHKLGWKRDVETKYVRRRILSGYQLLLRGYDPTLGIIPDWLPGDFHQRWADILVEGRRPDIGYNRGGFYVRSWSPKKDKAEGADKQETDATQEAPGAGDSPRKFRFKLVPLADIKPGPEPLYLVDELIPVAGLVVLWGKRKCGKSFCCLDMVFHVSVGREYRDRSVQQGPIVYFAFEGGHGYKKRVEALRRHYGAELVDSAPLYIVSGHANLIKEHRLLISEITAQLNGARPGGVVLDTLNKSLHGSESSDEDMSGYIRAAEVVRDAFGCVVIIIHHCGYDESRMRGHSALPAALDAQLAVTRAGNTVTITVEAMRDGPEDIQVISEMQVVEVGHDRDGKVLTSMVVVPADEAAPAGGHRGWPKMLAVFHAALLTALKRHGTAHQPDAFTLPVRAVDLEVVRAEFYGTYAATGDTDEQRGAAVRKAFNRQLERAQRDGLIEARVLPGKQTLLWIAGASA